ncbi:benzoate 4-monooxygenase cytochrome p450 [Seiridium cupressi]
MVRSLLKAPTATRRPYTHQLAGNVVRIAPNEVSFASAEAWKEIYGHATGGKMTFLKSAFYQTNDYPGVIAVRDPREHARQRKSLSNAFSARSLRGQEPIVRQYVDLFIEQAGRIGNPTGPGLDVEQAFNWLTFDIIGIWISFSILRADFSRLTTTVGDLAFGESFNATADAQQHPWVSIITDSAFSITMLSLQRRLPLVKLALPFILPKELPEWAATHRELTKEKTLKRVKMADEIDRPDFFQQLLSKGGGGVHLEELFEQSNNLIIAGSETTATFLITVTYHLIKNKRCLDELTHEIRSAFQTPQDITADRCSELKYLNAVIEEGLRIWPPVPFGQPRTSPGAVVDGTYLPPGTTVAVDMWSVHHNSRYWKDPDSFVPERWIGEGLGDNKDAFNPFLVGPRACLGINLAYLEMRIILSLLVFTYDWELVDPDLDFWKEARTHMFWKKPPLLVRYYPRKD